MKIHKNQLIVVLEDESQNPQNATLLDLFPKSKPPSDFRSEEEISPYSFDISFVRIYIFQILYTLDILHNQLGYVHR